MTDRNPRTAKQNSSLHGTLTAYSEKLNDAGFDYIDFVHIAKMKGFAVVWTKDNLKQLFDVVTLAMYNKTSSQLSTVEIQAAYQIFEHKLAEQSGVSHRWHSREQQMLESKNKWWGEPA